MTLKSKYDEMLKELDEDYFNTWFELGLFMDKMRDSQPERYSPTSKSLDEFKTDIAKGIGFLTFYYAIDGVSIEVAKYARAFEALLGKEKAKIHLIAGDFRKNYDSIMDPAWKSHQIDGVDGFDVWDGYKNYFETKLSRGSQEYNELNKKIMEQTKKLVKALGQYISDNDIHILFPINIASNPGNIPLALALTIISEYMDIPVLNSSHDFYWEGGSRQRDKKTGELPGVRDHFFKNADIGEVFSPVEMLFPWDSKRWLQSTINTTQISNLISTFGFNPINLLPLPTSVNTEVYQPADDKRKKDIQARFKNILSDGKETLQTRDINHFSENDASKWYDVQTPLFMGCKSKIECSFDQDTIIMLQPTRVITRKNIQRNFDLLHSLLKNDTFSKHMDSNPNLTITHHTTGPIAVGHNDYFISLIEKFKQLYSKIPEKYRERIFMSFTFGTEENDHSKNAKSKPLIIEDIFAAASVILLASETEGRGLPIIEASATGIPVVSNRYDPIKVYKEVVGEDLPPESRLQILEFPPAEHKGDYPKELTDKLANIFINPKARADVSKHNINVIKKRFSDVTLKNAIDRCLTILWTRFKHKPAYDKIDSAIETHKTTTKYDDSFKSVVHSNRRSYLPGFTQIEFMIYLKSLIDPSFFRIEEKEVKGRVMDYALELIEVYKASTKVTNEHHLELFSQIDDLFEYEKGVDELAIDHSLSYRHRNRKHFPYRKFTEQELQGVIAELLRQIIGKNPTPTINEHGKAFSTNITEALKDYYSEYEIEIDDRVKLSEMLKEKRPIAIFPDKSIANETSIFAVSYFKSLLGISESQKIEQSHLKDLEPAKLVIFTREKTLNSNIAHKSVENWITSKAPTDVQFLHKHGLIELIKTEQLSAGVHLGQLGANACKKLVEIKKNNGVLISFGFDSFITLDLLDINSFRLGTVKNKLKANFMNINEGSAFISYVPASLRPSLAYPTPIQTPKEFSSVLKGGLFKNCVEKFTEEKLLEAIYKDSDEYGTPLAAFLNEMRNEGEATPYIHKKINGKHSDGLPWSGAMVKVALKENPWKFTIVEASRDGSTVLSLISDYENKHNTKISFGWNGGYILNPELVGKLGLSEDYIGSPLGLLIVDNKIKALPLFNKPTLGIDKDHKLVIKRANLQDGFTIKASGKEYKFDSSNRNKESHDDVIFYDMMYEPNEMPAKGRIVYRFVGNKIIERLTDQDKVKVLPVGISLSVPENHELKSLKPGETFDFEIPGWESIICAIEAGPFLVENKSEAINMELGGWKTDKSILTQAARIDYTDMRGPKIAAGITKDNELIIIAVNGRIRESVGATHTDIAAIMLEQKAETAIGFDPGGSATLVAGGEQLNVSPYNKDYEENIYTKPPEPRRVGNAIFAELPKKQQH